MASPRNKSYFVSQRCIRGKDAALRRPRDSYVQKTAQCAVFTIDEMAPSRSSSQFAVHPLWRVVANLIKEHRNVVSSGNERLIASFDGLTIIFARRDHDQKLVHKWCHSQRGAGLAEWRHIKDDVVEIARLKVRHEVKEFLQTKLGGSSVGRRHRCEIEILRSGIHPA